MDEDVAEFVDQIFDGFHLALWELDDQLTSLTSRGQLGKHYRRAFADRLAFLVSEHLEESRDQLLEGLGPDPS